jgi:hypothetical protein
MQADIRVGTLELRALHIEVEMTDTRVSFMAYTRLRPNCDIDQGGQMQDTIRAALDAHEIRFVDDWTPTRLRRVLDLWDAWHLNDMTAGCEHQRAGIAADDDDPDAGIPWDARPIDPSKPTDTYGKHYDGQRSASWNMLAWVPRRDHPRGLLAHQCPECGYGYGTSWLTVEIPADVREEIRDLILTQSATAVHA